MESNLTQQMDGFFMEAVAVGDATATINDPGA
jgi:hypothetical protein